jgi:hypothetical protein
MAAVLFGFSVRTQMADAAPRVHDGVYAHAGLLGGPGFVTYDAPMSTDVQHRGQATGTTFGLELSLGGTLPGGVVVGGMLLAHSQSEPSFDDPTVTQGWDSTTNGVGGIALFARFYPNPRGGFHVDALLGPASHRTRHEREIPPPPLTAITCPVIFPACWDDNQPRKLEATETSRGYLLGLGAGYELWITNQFSLGLAARMDYAHTWSGARSYTFLMPALVVGGTYQ